MIKDYLILFASQYQSRHSPFSYVFYSFIFDSKLKPLGSKNVCTKCNKNPSSSCSDVSTGQNSRLTRRQTLLFIQLCSSFSLPFKSLETNGFLWLFSFLCLSSQQPRGPEGLFLATQSTFILMKSMKVDTFKLLDNIYGYVQPAFKLFVQFLMNYWVLVFWRRQRKITLKSLLFYENSSVSLLTNFLASSGRKRASLWTFHCNNENIRNMTVLWACSIHLGLFTFLKTQIMCMFLSESFCVTMNNTAGQTVILADK